MKPDEIKKLGFDHYIIPMHDTGYGEYNAVEIDDLEAYTAAVEARERERLCTAIKAEDDHCADGDYMMDSDDCISVVKGTWERPDWNGELK